MKSNSKIRGRREFRSPPTATRNVLTRVVLPQILVIRKHRDLARRNTARCSSSSWSIFLHPVHLYPRSTHWESFAYPISVPRLRYRNTRQKKNIVRTSILRRDSWKRDSESWNHCENFYTVLCNIFSILYYLAHYHVYYNISSKI